VGHTRHENQALGILHRVNDPVVADADAVVVATRELHAADRPRVACERIDRIANAVAYRSLEPPELPSRRRSEPYLVRSFRAYSRTSAHGTALSRSSRA
jgi:hypothetical protein